MIYQIFVAVTAHINLRNAHFKGVSLLQIYFGTNLNFTVGEILYTDMTTNDDSSNNITIIVIVVVAVVVLIVLLIIIVIACTCTCCKRKSKTSLEITNASAVTMYSSPACDIHGEPGMDHLNGPTDEENTTTFQNVSTFSVQLVMGGYIKTNNANEMIGQSDATREEENVEEYVRTLSIENQGHDDSTVAILEEEEHI